jgi:hypothetical protein
MGAPAPHRQAAARMPARAVARTARAPGTRGRRITVVTRISSAGMLPKHANGKVPPISLFWETTVSLGKKFFRSRSPFAAVPRYAVVEADTAPSWPSRVLRLPIGADQTDPSQAGDRRADGEGLKTASSEQPPRPAMLAAGSGLMLKAVARCGASVDLAFANFPVAIVSWIVAQVLTGCAAYAEAMYPSVAYLPQGEDADRRDPQPSGAPASGGSGRSPRLAPDLRELSRFAIDGGTRSPLPTAGRIRLADARPGGTAKIVRLATTRRAAAGRLVSLALIVTAWLAGRWQPRGKREAIVELPNHDRRTLRGVRFSR